MHELFHMTARQIEALCLILIKCLATPDPVPQPAKRSKNTVTVVRGVMGRGAILSPITVVKSRGDQRVMSHEREKEQQPVNTLSQGPWP